MTMGFHSCSQLHSLPSLDYGNDVSYNHFSIHMHVQFSHIFDEQNQIASTLSNLGTLASSLVYMVGLYTGPNLLIL